MNIISQFQDYYDSVLAHGRDDTVVYVRHPSLVQAKTDVVLPWNKVAGHRRTGVLRQTFVNENNPHSLNEAVHLVEGFVLIAGKSYPVWLRDNALRFSAQSPLLTQLNQRPKGVWMGSPDFQRLLKNTQEHWKDLGYTSDQPVFVPQKNRYREKDTSEYLKARQEFQQHDFTDWHLTHEAPVLLVLPQSQSPIYDLLGQVERDNSGQKQSVFLIKNPPLHVLNMASVLDPYTCFQEISQFISGVVPGQHMPMVQLSDKDMVKKKGFDEKYGFRTRPQK